MSPCVLTHKGRCGKHYVLRRPRRLKLVVVEVHRSWMECAAVFAGSLRMIHLTGDMDKHVFAKAHLLYIEVPERSETSLLPPGF